MTKPATLAYMAVRHLPTAEAARQLGKAYQSVEEYRRNHPEAAYNAKAGKPEKTQRPGTISLAIPIVEPSRSCAVNGERIMHVTLPAPPWGGTFERQGVQP